MKYNHSLRIMFATTMLFATNTRKTDTNGHPSNKLKPPWAILHISLSKAHFGRKNNIE